MMEELNRTLFLWINATPDSPARLLELATFIAKDLIAIVPMLIVALWLWGPHSGIRELVLKTGIALLYALAISGASANCSLTRALLPLVLDTSSCRTRRMILIPAIMAPPFSLLRWRLSSGTASGRACCCWQSASLSPVARFSRRSLADGYAGRAAGRSTGLSVFADGRPVWPTFNETPASDLSSAFSCRSEKAGYVINLPF